MVPHTLRALLCACLLSSTLGAADNLIFNGGFELGTAGFEVNKNLRPETNPTLVFEGAVLDSVDKVSGNQSLKIPNRFAEFMELYARGVTLKPNTTYTFSLSMRTDVDALSVTPLVVANDFKPARSRTFTVGKTWKRFSYSLTTGPFKVAGETSPVAVAEDAPPPAVRGSAIWIRTNLDAANQSAGPANTLWFDDLQLIEGTATVFAPSAEVEAAVTVAKDLYVEGDGLVGVTTVVRNTSARAVRGSVALRLEEEEGAPAKTVAGFDLTLAAGESRTVTQSVLVDRFGSFTIVPELRFDATVDALPAWFSRVGKYVAAEAHVDLSTTFCISNNDGLGSGYGPKGTMLGRNASADDFLTLYAKMGGRMMRLWDSGYPVNWNTNEATARGVYTDTYSDLVVDKLYNHGIAPVPVLGGSWITPITVDKDHKLKHPQWLVDSSVSVTAGSGFANEGYRAFLPPDDYWRSHVARMVNRYKGKVTHWEIMNEPNIWIYPPTPIGGDGKELPWVSGSDAAIKAQAEQYVVYLKSAAEEIRAADPTAKIVGFCPTGDMGSRSTVPFIAGGIAAGGLNYADVVSFHPYSAAHLGSQNPADTALAAIRAETAKARPDVPLWNTEVYYLNEEGSRGDSAFVRPRHVASRVLIDLGEGVAQSCSVDDSALWKKTLNPGFINGANSRWLPSANFVAYNTLARHLEGAKPVAGGKVALGPDTNGYVYQRRDGSFLAALWNYRPVADLDFVLPSAISGARRLDVFGNALPGGVLTVGTTPRYLLAPSGMTAVDFIAALRAAAPPAITCVPVGVKDLGDTVVLRAVVVPIAGRTITKVTFAADGAALGNATYNGTSGLWEYSYKTTKAGRLAITTTATDSAGAVRTGTRALAVGSLGTYGNNGQPWTVPAGGTLRIEAENFDEGGEGAAFHDTGGLHGDVRTRFTGSLNEVDLKASATEKNSDGTIRIRASGTYVGSTDGSTDLAKREWLRYTVKLPTAGRYRLRFGASNSVGGGNDGVQKDKSVIPPHVLALWNGIEVGAVGVLPRTSSWNDFQPFETTTTTELPAGTGLLEIAFDNWGVALNWIEIGPAPVAGNRLPVFSTPEPITLVCAVDGSGALDLSASDPDGDSLKWSVATAPKVGTAAVSSAGRLTVVSPDNHGSGDYCVVRVEDGRGGVATIRIELDVFEVNGAPVAIVHPVVSPLVVGAPVSLTATATDPDSVVQTVKFFANGTSIGTGTNAAAGWGVVWTPVAAGSYALTAQATDELGRVGTRSAALNVKVLAKGTAQKVTDECGVTAPVERVRTDCMNLSDAEAIKPFGDATRMVPYYASRTGTATWRVTNASAVWFSYALTDGQPTAITAEASRDGITFTAVATVGDSVGLAAPWHVFDGAVAALPAGTNYVRLSLSSIGAVHNWDTALLWVQIDSVAGGGSATPATLPANFKVSLVPVAGQGGKLQLVFGPVLAGWTYTPEYCTDLAAGNWLALSAYDETNNGPQRTITDLSASGARRFYRIRVTPAP